MSLVYLTGLVRFCREPGPTAWLVMTAAAALAWYAQPVLMLAVLPLGFVYHGWVATKHGWVWHMALAASAAVGLGVNAAWLRDWVGHLWICLPFGGEGVGPSAGMPAADWTMFLPSDPLDVGIAAAGLAGLVGMARKHRGAAWVLGLAGAAFVGVGGLGKFWPTAAAMGTQKLLLVAVWCAAVPAAFALAAVAGGIGQSAGSRAVGAGWLVLGLIAVAWSLDLPERVDAGRPLEVGLNAERRGIVRASRSPPRRTPASCGKIGRTWPTAGRRCCRP